MNLTDNSMMHNDLNPNIPDGVVGPECVFVERLRNQLLLRFASNWLTHNSLIDNINQLIELVYIVNSQCISIHNMSKSIDNMS